MSADALYWFGSTIAQSVVALLAFGAFIGIWRRDAIWTSIEPKLMSLAKDCKQIGDSKMEFSEKQDDGVMAPTEMLVKTYLRARDAYWIYENAVEKVQEFVRATDPDDRLEALKSATEPWLDFDFPDMGGEVLNHLPRIQSHGSPVIVGLCARTRIKESLTQLVRAGLGSFVLSLGLIALAEPMTAKHAQPILVFAGFAVFVLLVSATVLSVAAAANLAKASFGETGAPIR